MLNANHNWAGRPTSRRIPDHADPLSRSASTASPQPSLFDPLPPPAPSLPYGGQVPVHRDASDTEIAAAAKVPAAGLRGTVLRWIAERGETGLSAGEGGALYAATRGLHAMDARCRTTVGPRCTELKAAGLIRDSGVRRQGQIVWVLTDAGRRALS